jgi:hypothetical protein
MAAANVKARKNARKTALPTSTTDYKVRFSGKTWTLSAKDFPDKEVFRVYAVYGDVTDMEGLTAAIEALFMENGIQRRRIELSL